MAVFKIKSCGLTGIDGFIAEVEADVSGGLASFEIVGLPDTAVKESKERIKSALKNSQSEIYKKRIVVNLAPASEKKEGSGFDLPIALAVAACESEFRKDITESSLFIGELSLDGKARKIPGILPMAITAYQKGIKNFFVPAENAAEAAVIQGLNVFPVDNLFDLCEFLKTGKGISPLNTGDFNKLSGEFKTELDFSDVRGQENIKRALMVAACGGHNLLMAGSPGAGKTMIASRIPSILPPLGFEDSLEVSKIYSVAGLLNDSNPLVLTRPFRQLHHTVSTIGITGGGKNLKPGEISLAHKGVLFLDELPEFKRDALETLRQPLEDGFITITRVSGTAVYPASVMLIASLNPCPCGFFGSGIRECTCTEAKRKNYVRKISGPLLDRIDIQIEVAAVEYSALSDKTKGLSSKEMRERVTTAREIQKERYKNLDFDTNKDIPPGMLDEICRLGKAENQMMEAAYNKLGLSARAHSRILKVARSAADLDGSKEITVSHIAEAIQYRSIDKKYFNGGM